MPKRPVAPINPSRFLTLSTERGYLTLIYNSSANWVIVGRMDVQRRREFMRVYTYEQLPVWEGEGWRLDIVLGLIDQLDL